MREGHTYSRWARCSPSSMCMSSFPFAWEPRMPFGKYECLKKIVALNRLTVSRWSCCFFGTGNESRSTREGPRGRWMMGRVSSALPKLNASRHCGRWENCVRFCHTCPPDQWGLTGEFGKNSCRLSRFLDRCSERGSVFSSVWRGEDWTFLI